MPKILVIDDEEILGELLVENLRNDGFEAQYESNPLKSLECLDSFKADLIIVDKIMPFKSGIEVIDEIKQTSTHHNTPIIMLTGCKSKNDLIECYEHDIDDFMTKPFDYEELKARINANLKKRAATESNVLNFKNIQMDTMSRVVQVEDQEIHLTLTEYKLLKLLLVNTETVISREEMLQKAFGDANIIARTVDVHMASLRKKLGLSSESIKTVRGLGYKMSA